MQPEKTYHLEIQVKADLAMARQKLKEDIKDWLIGIGEENIVEGTLDHLFLDLDYAESAEEQYERMGGNDTPLSIYKYDLKSLEKIKVDLEKVFSQQITCEITPIETEKWMEGWKESFKPIVTDRFYVYPPWDSACLPTDKLAIVIEPGMAFGTGQHATTLLCLKAIEWLDRVNCSKNSFLDVGTGTGILAIAAKKIGYNRVAGTDTDPDAIIACSENSRVNEVKVDVWQESLPLEVTHQSVVVANIIFFVLSQIIGQLASRVQEQGWLVLSGLLVEEQNEMKNLAQGLGLIFEHQMESDGWICQIYRKP